jgi:hypothetical protein
MRRYSPLLMILVLLGSLGASPAAFAAATNQLAPTAAATASSFEPEEEAEEGEEEEFEVVEEIEFEACEATAEDLEFAEMELGEEEEFEEEVEECEEEAALKSKGKAVTAPAACTIRSAESTIATIPGSDKVRLTIHYKADSSAAVAIQLRLKDHKGSLSLERTNKHFGKNGVLHLTTKLGQTEMERALDAHEFDVGLRATGTPGYCSDMLEQKLSTKHSSGAHGASVYSARAQASKSAAKHH